MVLYSENAATINDERSGKDRIAEAKKINWLKIYFLRAFKTGTEKTLSLLSCNSWKEQAELDSNKTPLLSFLRFYMSKKV